VAGGVRAPEGRIAGIRVRPADAGNVPLIHSLIRELAVYERLAHTVVSAEADLARHLFGASPAAEVLIGELDGEACGFALFFRTFSTFVGKPGIYLEDLYVRPAARGRGVGRALLSRLAQLAVERGCGRVEWAVLDWNEPAERFYRGMGAERMEEWRVFRLAGEALARAAGSERA
jgi:GNAT superfamily N-acetyltransferase